MSTTPSPLIPENPSPQLQAALKFLQSANDNDMNLLGSVVAEDYVHTVLPASLNAPTITGRDAIVKFYSNIMLQFASFAFTILEITEGPGKVITHAMSDGHTKSGYHYLNEYMITFAIAQQKDGSYKIAMVQEFADSEATIRVQKVLSGAGGPPK